MNKFPRIFVNWKQRKKQESSASPDDCVTLNHHQPSLVFHGPRVLYRNPAKNYEYAPNLSSSSSSSTLSSSTNTSQVIQSDAEPRESVRSLSVFGGNRTSDLGSELSSLKCYSAADEAGSGNGDRLSGARDVGFKVNFTDWHKGRHLGQGSFGKVYEGFNSENGQLCAIKEVKLKSRECLKQLNQEINLLSQLSHPNIVRYYGSELGDKTLSIYLEYVYGGSIHKLLQEYGPFKEPVIRNYTRQILSGLAYLHARKTVHR